MRQKRVEHIYSCAYVGFEDLVKDVFCEHTKSRVKTVEVRWSRDTKVCIGIYVDM